jgi:hypothetical protein
MQSERTGFEGRITISLRSEAQHPQGETQARGIFALNLKTPASEFCPAVRDQVSPTVRAEPVEVLPRFDFRVLCQVPVPLYRRGGRLTFSCFAKRK